MLIDANQERSHRIDPPRYVGKERVKESIEVPNYPGVQAKLVIFRASKRFERTSNKTRLGGVVVKSEHAIHEATLFDNELEVDPHCPMFLWAPYLPVHRPALESVRRSL